MAKFSIGTKEVEAILNELNKAGDVDSWAPKALAEAAPILEQSLKSRASSHNRTGSMAGSIKPTKPKSNKYGHYVVVRPTGKDKKGVRNMEKMVYTEYGTSRQSATPVLVPALKDSEDAVNAKLKEVFEREVLGK